MDIRCRAYGIPADRLVFGQHEAAGLANAELSDRGGLALPRRGCAGLAEPRRELGRDRRLRGADRRAAVHRCHNQRGEQAGAGARAWASVTTFLYCQRGASATEATEIAEPKDLLLILCVLCGKNKRCAR